MPDAPATAGAPIFARRGLVYWVPCIRLERPFFGLTWVPVIGGAHSDPDLVDSDLKHLHIDWRFVSSKVVTQCSHNVYDSPMSRVISNTTADPEHHRLEGEIVQRRLKCLRQMPEFPAMQADRWELFEAGFRKRCERLIDGHICPHRGIDLRPFAKEDGTAVCPGHGLHWDLRTGKLLKHHKAAPKSHVPYVPPVLGEV